MMTCELGELAARQWRVRSLPEWYPALTTTKARTGFLISETYRVGWWPLCHLLYSEPWQAVALGPDEISSEEEISSGA